MSDTKYEVVVTMLHGDMLYKYFDSYEDATAFYDNVHESRTYGGFTILNDVYDEDVKHHIKYDIEAKKIQYLSMS